MIEITDDLNKKKGIFEPLDKYIRECDDGDVSENEKINPIKRTRLDSFGNIINEKDKSNYSISFMKEVTVCKYKSSSSPI